MHKPIALIAMLLFGGLVESFADNRQIHLIVGFEAGGTSDSAARIIAESAKEIAGITVIVENRPGASGLIAAESVQREQNPRTLLFMSSTSLLKVRPDSGLVPVGMVATFSYVAVIKKGGKSPAILAAYMDAASRDNKLLSAATAGAGSVAHLVGVKLFSDHGMTLVHIPHRGSAPAIQSVLGEHVPLAVVPAPDYVRHKERLHPIAESGKEIEGGGWVGIFAPSNTSPEEIAQLAKIFQTASVRSEGKLKKLGFRQSWQSGDELGSAYRNEYKERFPMLEKLEVKP